MTGDEIRAIRNRWGLSWPRFADLIGVNERTARRWESEALAIPVPAQRLVRILDDLPLLRQQLMIEVAAGGEATITKR